MAITERYADFNGSGTDSGTEANPWLTPASITANAVAGDRINVLDGARYTIATSWASSTAGSATQPIIFRGYTTTIGDGGKCKVGGSIADVINITGAYNYFEDFDIETSSTQYSNGITFASAQGMLSNCKIVSTTTGLMSRYTLDASWSTVINCYIEGRASNSASNSILKSTGVIVDSVVKSVNGQAGILISANYLGMSISHTVVYSEASTTLTGIRVEGLTNTNGMNIDHFTVDGFDSGVVFQNLPNADNFAGNLSCGVISGASDAISTDEATIVTGVSMVNIAFYDNINDYSDMGDNEVMNPIALTDNPYIDSANGDFRPNIAAAGGALLRGQTAMGAGTITQHLDIGAVQSQHIRPTQVIGS